MEKYENSANIQNEIIYKWYLLLLFYDRFGKLKTKTPRICTFGISFRRGYVFFFYNLGGP